MFVETRRAASLLFFALRLPFTTQTSYTFLHRLCVCHSNKVQ